MQRKIGLFVVILSLMVAVFIQQPGMGKAAGSGEPSVRVNLSDPFSNGNPTSLSLCIHGTYQINGIGLTSGNTYRIDLDESGGLVFKRSDGSRIIGGTLLSLTCSNHSSDYIELLTAKSYPYREGMEFTLSGTTIKTVNVIQVENYLKSVVPAESYPSWGKEALKAQAVAARSYVMEALSRIGNSEVTDTTAFQKYNGMKEASSTTVAVNETKGMVLSYGGKTISALFSSTNGGYSELSSNVWNGDNPPYYASRPDPYDAKVPDYKNWTVSYSADQVQQMLQKYGINVGSIKDLQILSTFPSGRIQDLAIIGSWNVSHLGKNAARSYFGLKSALYKVTNNQKVYILNGTGTKQEGIIQGNYVASSTITKQSTGELVVLASNGTTKTIPATPTFTFTGSGFGHGIGMSQFGAMQMANEGKTYIEILTFYYPNASLSALY